MTSHRSSSSPAPRQSRSARVARVGVLAALVVGVVATVRLASRSSLDPAGAGSAWRTWSTSTDPATALLPLLIGALALSVLFLGTVTALYCVLRACGCARLAAGMAWMVVPRLRTRLDRAIAVGVLASVIAVGSAGNAAYAEDDASVVRQPDVATVVADPGAPAPIVGDGPIADIVREPDAPTPAPIADPAPTVDTPVARTPDADVADSADRSDVDGADQGDVVSGRADDPVTEPSTDALLALQDQARQSAGEGDSAVRGGAQPDASPQTPAPPTAAPTARDPQRYTVVNGDNLWAISAQQVARVRGVAVGALSDADVAAYWVQVVEANRTTIRSGNPNLIYAGEVLTLPVAS